MHHYSDEVLHMTKRSAEIRARVLRQAVARAGGVAHIRVTRVSRYKLDFGNSTFPVEVK